MKKTLFLTAVTALFMASCTKDRTCTCTSSSNGTQGDPSTTTIVDATKGQAKANCVSTKETDGSDTYTTDCKLS
jgi:hypothetical protein